MIVTTQAQIRDVADEVESWLHAYMTSSLTDGDFIHLLRAINTAGYHEAEPDFAICRQCKTYISGLCEYCQPHPATATYEVDCDHNYEGCEHRCPVCNVYLTVLERGKLTCDQHEGVKEK